jgi:hypothetical protein
VTAAPTLSRIRWSKTCRLIATRYPSVGVFDRVVAPDDLAAILELEAWTNDRISTELGVLQAVPPEEWVTGRPMASVIMAAFCHPRPDGARFSDARRGAWYCGRTLATALAESVYHRTLELRDVGHFDTRVQMRLYHADFSTTLHDIRGDERARTRLYDPRSYEQSQTFGLELFDQGSNGLVYRSVRHPGGECLVSFRPGLVLNVRVAAHYEYRWDGTPDPRVVRLSS